MNHIEAYMENHYQKVSSNSTNFNFGDILTPTIRHNLEIIAQMAENSKGVLAVVCTSLIYKALNPNQDIRCHQSSIEGGYSGRTFDSHYVTPFLRSKSFPNMAESGWLTRSLEQKVPYNLDYPGAIQPRELKVAFLNLLDEISETDIDIDAAFEYLLFKLIEIRDAKRIEIARPQNLSIHTIVGVLDKHFYHKYNSRGASRLPVLALYSLYQVLIGEIKRFDEKVLLPLENHTSADKQSGRLADIDIVDNSGMPFEAVEVKFDIPVSVDIIERAKSKILPTSIKRYYILSTLPVKAEEKDEISKITTQIKNVHGCALIVNGVIDTIKYYLRLLDNTAVFIDNYASLLETDSSIKYEHREVWNKIIADI